MWPCAPKTTILGNFIAKLIPADKWAVEAEEEVEVCIDIPPFSFILKLFMPPANMCLLPIDPAAFFGRRRL